MVGLARLSQGEHAENGSGGDTTSHCSATSRVIPYSVAEWSVVVLDDTRNSPSSHDPTAVASGPALRGRDDPSPSYHAVGAGSC